MPLVSSAHTAADRDAVPMAVGPPADGAAPPGVVHVPLAAAPVACGACYACLSGAGVCFDPKMAVPGEPLPPPAAPPPHAAAAPPAMYAPPPAPGQPWALGAPPLAVAHVPAAPPLPGPPSYEPLPMIAEPPVLFAYEHFAREMAVIEELKARRALLVRAHLPEDRAPMLSELRHCPRLFILPEVMHTVEAIVYRVRLVGHASPEDPFRSLGPYQMDEFAQIFVEHLNRAKGLIRRRSYALALAHALGLTVAFAAEPYFLADRSTSAKGSELVNGLAQVWRKLVNMKDHEIGLETPEDRMGLAAQLDVATRTWAEHSCRFHVDCHYGEAQACKK